MKQIILVRHAKSSWNFDVSDIKRPLKSRGINDAKLVSNKLIENDFEVNSVFSSPANRALSTCKIFMKNLNISPNLLKTSHDIYDFGGNKVVDFIKLIDESYKNVMIFGHNHAFTAIANTYGSVYIDNVPTSGVVVLQFNIKYWKDLKPGSTIMTLFPKQLKV